MKDRKIEKDEKREWMDRQKKWIDRQKKW
jgi:hypothetical protein